MTRDLAPGDPELAQMAPGMLSPWLINDNGGWCWFEDERAIFHDGRLLVGTIATATGPGGESRAGNAEATLFDFETGERTVFVLHPNYEQDDHNSPAFLELPDGRVLSTYTRHGTDTFMRWRIGVPGDGAIAWGDEKTLDVGEGVTYSNTFLVEGDRGKPVILNFTRALKFNPTVLVSHDLGESFEVAGRLMGRPGRPYLNYAQAPDGAVHFIATDEHPRDVDNSLYHGVVRWPASENSKGHTVAPQIGVEPPPRPEQFTTIFAGDADNVAWGVDIEVDRARVPTALFQVNHDKQEPRSGGMDIRFHHARLVDGAWVQREIAHAGTRLYQGEDDYSGLGAIDPADPFRLVISTDADPVTGEPLISAADGQRRHELFLGRSTDEGETWSWQPITRDSTADNLRPIIPRGGLPVVLWLRGEYRTYRDYDLKVLAIPLPPR